MAGLTEENLGEIFGKTECKSCLNEDTKAIHLDPLQPLVFVRYCNPVLYNRASPFLMQPQIREAGGWLICEAEQYIILSWDRDAGPPTLHGGDPKASDLVLLKSDIVRWIKFCPPPLPKNLELTLKSKQPIQESEYAFRPSERKTRSPFPKGEKKP
jgi:hypothetical protein